jgi:WhiB family transcriptional regulator, redox-sensing transcriptional regulator
MAPEDPPAAEDWRLKAACRPLDSDLFFPNREAYRSEVARAKAVCGECQVRAACLQAAMDGRETVGIWGGLTPQERAKLHRRNRRVRDDAGDVVDDATMVEQYPAADAGYPTREQIRRGVAAGWLRVDPVQLFADGDAPRV